MRVATGSSALLALVLLSACASIPQGHSAIDDLTIRGVQKIDDSDLAAKLATAPSPKLIGLFRGVVYDYEVFNRSALQRDLARAERFCRARGFFEAHARAGRVIPTGQNHVRVEIVIEEGLPVVVDEVKIEGLDRLPPTVAAAAQKAVTDKLVKGKIYDEDDFKAAEVEARRALTDRGYAYAKVAPDAYVDLVKHVVNTVFVVTPGEPAVFGKVTIVGLEGSGAGPLPKDIPEAPVRRAIAIQEGDPYSTEALAASTQALFDLEVFSAVEMLPELPDPPPASHIVPLTVKVTPTALHQLKLGGGVELDQIKTDVHLLVGWEDHNFLGGLRDFTVDFKPGVVLYPTRINNFVVPDTLLPEARLRLQLRQPGFIESRTSLFIRPEANMFPLLVQTKPLPEDPVVGYHEIRGAIGLDRTLWKLFGSISYNVQVENPFVYKGELDSALKTLIIAYPELLLQLDLRDSKVHPHKGIFIGNDIQIAGLGGSVIDLKVQPEVRTYIPVARKITFATRGSLGFLFPSSYGGVIENHLSEPVTPENRAERVRDIQTTLFRGLFSGGPTSNRGFPIRGVSPHGVVPFLNPSTAVQQVALACAPSATGAVSTDPVCSIPVGGFTLWELSNEVRFQVAGPFSAATFCDMSDVSPKPANLRFGHLHLSCGFGVRYETPIGPLRLDIGYRIQPFQVLGYANEDAAFAANPTEGVQPKIFGVPLAVAFGIGEAY